jgi:hypothetical protein
MSNNFKKHTDCTRYQNLIQKRLDGDITPEENRELDEHLADCPPCLDELTSYAAVKDLLNETLETPAEVPEGFFENLAEQLDEVKPARGFAAIFSHPLLRPRLNFALATASVVLVAVLTVSVGSGMLGRFGKDVPTRMNPTESKAMILTNGGETFELSGDEGDSDRYAAALDDLERAYLEARGMNADKNSDGYIYTSWGSGESATPLK